MPRALTKSFLLALGLLLGAEGVVRVFFVRNMSGRFEYGYHPTAGFEETPEGNVNLVRAGGRRFRPQTFAAKPAPDALRVFVIGDSVPRGPGLETAYPWQVGGILRTNGVRAESLNLGVPGYGAHRNRVMVARALDFAPDLVVLHVNVSNEFEDEREWRRSREFRGWHPKNWLMKSLVIRRIYEAKTEKVFWEWLPVSVRRQRSVNDADAELQANQDATTQRRWDDRVRRHTAESVALCRERGVPVLLVSQAFLKRHPDGSAELEARRVHSLIEPLAGEGVGLVSMGDALRGHDVNAIYYHDGTHVRAEGHRLLAEMIVKEMMRSGLTNLSRRK